MKNLVLFLILTLSHLSFSQRYYKPRKVSDAKGTFFGSWGYNRTVYSKSKIHFEGDGYNFDLKNARAFDRPVRFSLANYFKKETILAPQFSASLGYNYTDNWAFTFEAHHYKYVFIDENHVTFNGQASNMGTVNFGNGNIIPIGKHDDTPIVTNTEEFHYENTNGLNFMAFGVMRTDRLFTYGGKNQFALTSNFGGSLGIIQTVNDFSFAGRKSNQTPSISGIGLKVASGLRFEFFRHVFVQSNLSAGYINTPHVKTRNTTSSKKSFAAQQFCYFGLDFSGGLLFYLNH